MKHGAHLTKPGWSKPHTHSNPTNLALFRHKITLYRFNQGGSYYCRGGSNGSRGAEPPEPPHFNHCFTRVQQLDLQQQLSEAEACCKPSEILSGGSCRLDGWSMIIANCHLYSDCIDITVSVGLIVILVGTALGSSGLSRQLHAGACWLVEPKDIHSTAAIRRLSASPYSRTFIIRRL